MASPSIHAMAEGESAATEYPSTTAGLQAAIDSLAGAKGKVFIGPGTLSTTTAIWLHSYCHVQGSGRGLTIIQRASGSITDADAANSGAVFATSAYGANGTLSSSSAIQYDITISDLTLDGNYSAFGSLTSGTPNQAGLSAASVDGLRCECVMVKNTLRSGIFTNECKNVMLSDIETLDTGQFTISTTKNAIDFYNYNNDTSGHGYNYSLSNFRCKNTTVGTSQVVVSCTNVQQVTISNGIGENFVEFLEIQGDSAASSLANRYITMTNIVGRGLTSEALLFAGVAGCEIGDITVENCTFEMSSSAHAGRVINIGAGVSMPCYNIRVGNCTFKNVNSTDTTAKNWIDLASNSNATYKDMEFHDIEMYGPSASTRTNDFGIRVLSTNATNIVLRNIYMKDVPGRGVHIGDVSGTTAITNIVIDNVFVDGSNGIPFQVAVDDGGTASIKDVVFTGCRARNGCKQVSDSALQLITNAAGVTLSQVRISNFTAYRDTGTTLLYGIDINETAGTMDDVSITDCDLSRVQTAPFRGVTGTPTNIHFNPRSGLGTAIASAATIAIPTDGSVFHVTGNTNVTNGITVNPWDNGRTVTLIFDGTPTVSDTGTSKLNAAFVATADDTLTLVCDGTNWYEVGNSAN